MISTLLVAIDVRIVIRVSLVLWQGCGMFRSRRLAIPAIVLAVGLSLAGCSAAGVHSNSGVAGGAQVGNAVAVPGSKVADGSASTSSDVIKRQVVTTGTVVVKTANPLSAADKAASIADAAGGRVDDRNQTAATRDQPAHASLTLRIPSARLTPALDQLKKLGTVESISISTDDVTTKSEDLNARITALQTSITRLLALESKATTTADLIALESDIASRQGDLESLTAQQRYLRDQISMSTITLELLAPSAAVVKPGPPSPASAFIAGLSGFGVVFNWIFLVLVYLLPWLILGAVIWVAIVYLLRWRRRRRAVPPAE
jgi:hypothetical protein